MYAKYISETEILEAPYYVKKDNKDIFGYNLDSNYNMLVADDYKIVEDSEAPTNMKQPRKVWVEETNKIVAKWVDDYVEPTVAEQNETISLKRNKAYENLTDQLTLRKLRKQVLGTWTTEDETNYIQQMKELSEEIDKNNPYV